MRSNVIGNFTIIEKIGEGGMGEVFKGIDTMLEREVAIKSLRPELTSHQELVTRFKTEAIALARLNHPNIATLYSFFRHDDQYFMVMEFVHGSTLIGFKKSANGIEIKNAVSLVCQALQGLSHAHGLGIIHKDIKPANMMLTTTNVIKIMDFGIARILEKTRLTHSGSLVGTLRYMSPEQLRGNEVNLQSDLYSMGTVLYEMLAGRPPFASNSDYELMKAKIEKTPPPLRLFNPKISLALEEVVLQALRIQPEKRFASANDFSRQLQNASRSFDTLKPANNQSSLTVRLSEEKTKKRHDSFVRSRVSSRRRARFIGLIALIALFGWIITIGYLKGDWLTSVKQIDDRNYKMNSLPRLTAGRPDTEQIPLAGFAKTTPVSKGEAETTHASANKQTKKLSPKHQGGSKVGSRVSNQSNIAYKPAGNAPSNPRNTQEKLSFVPKTPEPDKQKEAMIPSSGWAIEK